MNRHTTIFMLSVYLCANRWQERLMGAFRLSSARSERPEFLATDPVGCQGLRPRPPPTPPDVPIAHIRPLNAVGTFMARQGLRAARTRSAALLNAVCLFGPAALRHAHFEPCATFNVFRTIPRRAGTELQLSNAPCMALGAAIPTRTKSRRRAPNRRATSRRVGIGL